MVELVLVPANSENEMQKRLCKACPTALRKELNATNPEKWPLPWVIIPGGHVTSGIIDLE